MDQELITHVVTIAASFGVGWPILLQARRTGDVPAAWLAASLLFDGAEWLLWALYLYWPATHPEVSEAFATACRLGISAAVLSLGVFTWLTFRSGSRVAAAFFWASAGAMLLGLVGSGAVGDWPGFRADHPWIWIEVVAQILVYGWACGEPLMFLPKLRRRVAHGLADPIVTHKVALWAVYAGGYCVSQLMFLIALASPEGYTALDPLSTVLTLLGVAAIWLAFFPPAPYRAWLERERAPA